MCGMHAVRILALCCVIVHAENNATAATRAHASRASARGRRLLEKRSITRAASHKRAMKAMRESQEGPQPVQVLPPETYAAASNRTAELLATRRLLLQRVAEIDARLEEERNQRRKALMAKYEKELQELDDEAAALSQNTPGHGDSIGAIAAAIRRSGAHQDVAHQDIDVVLTHIDIDGDGIVSTAEMRGASGGAAFYRAATAMSGPMIGFIGGVFCYLLCRAAYQRTYRRTGTPSGGGQAGGVMRASALGGGCAGVGKPGTVNVGGDAGGAARQRKRQGPHPTPAGAPGPAIQC